MKLINISGYGNKNLKIPSLSDKFICKTCKTLMTGYCRSGLGFKFKCLYCQEMIVIKYENIKIYHNTLMKIDPINYMNYERQLYSQMEAFRSEVN